MAKYNTCPDCGCSLDFGEKCDCMKKFFPQDASENRHYADEDIKKEADR